MYESNINWILAIASVLAGIGIGALGYHLLNANVARNQKVRQRLAETELELSQVKNVLNEHFTSAAGLVKSIQHQSQELERQLLQNAERLSDDPALKRHLAATLEGSEESADSETPEVPRDYADGNHGTLSEDFGLHQPREEEAPTAQPARY